MHNSIRFNCQPTAMTTTSTSTVRRGMVMSLSSNDLIMRSREGSKAYENAMKREERIHQPKISQQRDKAESMMMSAPNSVVLGDENFCNYGQMETKETKEAGCLRAASQQRQRRDRSLALGIKRRILAQLAGNKSKSSRRQIYRQFKSILSGLLGEKHLVINVATSDATSSEQSQRLTTCQREFQEAHPNFAPIKPVDFRANLRVTGASESGRPAAKRTRSESRDDDDDEADSHCLSKRVCSAQNNVATSEAAVSTKDASGHESLFNNEMTEKHLWIITNHYENLADWKRLSLHLGLGVQDLQCIEGQHLQYDGLKECFYQALLKWRMREPENCYLAYFNQILTFKLGASHRQTSCLAAELVKYEESVKTSRDARRPLSSPLSQKQLWTASELLARDWKEIARSCLDLQESDVCSIERRFSASEGPRECSYQSLLLWSEALHPHASLSVLCSRLSAHKFNLYVRQLANTVSLRPN